MTDDRVLTIAESTGGADTPPPGYHLKAYMYVRVCKDLLNCRELVV